MRRRRHHLIAATVSEYTLMTSSTKMIIRENHPVCVHSSAIDMPIEDTPPGVVTAPTSFATARTSFV
jgi:hypothetical protein